MTCTAAEERVVLLDNSGHPRGTAAKRGLHTQDTPLHLAFSCYLFDDQGRLLVTRRSLEKVAWPGVWTNSFCGHPMPDELLTEAIHRRAEHELGLRVEGVEVVLPDFRYRAVDPSGIVENEVCPVYVARAATPVEANPEEVDQWTWHDPSELRGAAEAASFAFSPWMALQLPQVLDAIDAGEVRGA